MKKIRITCFEGGRKRKKNDWVTEETALEIRVNKKKVASLLCSPKDLKALVLGYLYTAGIIRRLSDMKSLRIDLKGCIAIAEVKSPAQAEKKQERRPAISIKNQKIVELMKEFHDSCKEFISTGGVHSSALCDKQRILISKADLGRHNAFDKVIGEALTKGINMRDKILLTSGRVPSEILNKALRCRIPIIASVSAPTVQAVRSARHRKVTLIGFARGQKMNIYSEEQRIQ